MRGNSVIMWNKVKLELDKSQKMDKSKVITN